MIPFYSFKHIHKEIEDQLIDTASKIIKSGNYVFNTNNFEQEFASYVGAKYCAAVSNGTAAIHLALLALGLKPGDEVITVAHTFRATIAAINYCGATPVYVDIDPYTLTLDPEKIISKISNKTKCIIPVHMYGNAADMRKIVEIANRYNLPVVEDCSQAHGTTIAKQHVGTFGKIGTFSFYPGKGLGALGDAGCIVTDDYNIYDYICKTRTWNDNDIGYNYRMSNLQAEFLRIKLRSFDKVLEEKRNIAEHYNKHFNYVKTLENVNHSYHVYPILVKDRNSFISDLKSKIELKSHYPVPVHQLTSYRNSVHLPNTENISKHQVSLPIYPGVDYTSVIEILNDHTSCLL